MPSVLLRKPEQQIAIEEIERKLPELEKELAKRQASRDTPSHMIDLAKAELEATRRRYEEMRKGAAA